MKYTLSAYMAISCLIGTKTIIFPFMIWRILPSNDFGAAIFEMCIMLMGGVTVLVYIFLGYLGKHVFHLSNGLQNAVNILVQTPIVFLDFYAKNNQVDSPLTAGLARMANAWSDLLAEPTRLLLFSYPWSEWIALIIVVISLNIGRSIDVEDDVETYPLRVYSVKRKG